VNQSEVSHQLVDLETGATRPVLPRPPVLSSEGNSWHGIIVQQFSAGEVENIHVAPRQHAVSVQLTPSGTLEWKQEGSPQRHLKKSAGQVSIFPAMSPISIRTRNTGEFLVIFLSPKFLKLATHEMVRSDSLELKPYGPFEEPFLKAVSLALHTELKAGNPGGRCYGETLASALAVHLARHYCGPISANGASPDGLGPAQFRRAVEYMHAHLSKDISLQGVAAAAGLSPFHFSRMFKRSAGLTPHQYLIRLRLERAKDLLLRTQDSVAEIALESGFCDQSHFAMHFKRVYGITPRAFSRKMSR
jgi:AraC family transcriptional regulator